MSCGGRTSGRGTEVPFPAARQQPGQRAKIPPPLADLMADRRPTLRFKTAKIAAIFRQIQQQTGAQPATWHQANLFTLYKTEPHASEGNKEIPFIVLLLYSADK